jgi:hypothetical protein
VRALRQMPVATRAASPPKRASARAQSPVLPVARTPRSTAVVQPKLAVGASGDRHDGEAHRVASSDQDAGRLQGKPVLGNETEAATAPRSVREVLSAPGRPLDAATRAIMEPRFGHDFGGVRVAHG